MSVVSSAHPCLITQTIDVIRDHQTNKEEFSID